MPAGGAKRSENRGFWLAFGLTLGDGEGEAGEKRPARVSSLTLGYQWVANETDRLEGRHGAVKLDDAIRFITRRGLL